MGTENSNGFDFTATASPNKLWEHSRIAEGNMPDPDAEFGLAGELQNGRSLKDGGFRIVFDVPEAMEMLAKQMDSYRGDAVVVGYFAVFTDDDKKRAILADPRFRAKDDGDD